MKRIYLFITTCFTTSLAVQAQPAPTIDAAGILQGLKKLNTVGSVLYIAAHPDDENTRLLAYLSSERKLRTGYISITRGDGGQNLVGKEQAEPLGLIRTQELLAARRIDGAEQFFTRANDFGFSKNPEETFSIWNKDSVLADLVWTIRKFKPDVLICRFPTTGEGGHGHHTASAILALEAFDAAADPKMFAYQLKYVSVWQARRVFWNTFNFGGNNTTAPDQLKLDVGVYNPLLGQGYGEIAAESRSMHKSQGFGSAKSRGSSLEYFKLLKGAEAKTDIFDGVDQTWKRFAFAAKIEPLVQACIKKYDAANPAAVLPQLAALHKALTGLTQTDPTFVYWRAQKLKEVENLMLACAGLWMEASTAHYMAIPGSTVNIQAQIVGRNGYPVTLNSLRYLQTDSVTNLALKPNEFFIFRHQATLPQDMPLSNPYWLSQPHSAGMYTVNDLQLIGQPENNPAATVIFELTIEGLTLKVQRPLIYKTTDPVRGEVYRPFEVLPPATVNLPEKVFVFSDNSPRNISFTVKANSNNVNGTLDISVPAGWDFKTSNNKFTLAKAGDEAVISGSLIPAQNATPGKLKANLSIDGKTYAKSITRIEYDHIPYQFILSEAEAGLVHVNLVKAGTRIGYIAGAGDDVPAALKQIGYNVTMLTDDMLTHDDLSAYNAIVTGVRAYNTNERLQVHYNRLMQYVNNGGNLVVQYNTNNRIGPVKANIGPYPFTISRDRVTNEQAEVRMPDPNNTLLNYPNKITSADFTNWIQERGIYFVTDRDSAYKTVFSINDPGEKPMDGSLIYTPYGKGNFIYTGLAFFRELPAGVPGAYRLFVNLLSMPARTNP